MVSRVKREGGVLLREATGLVREIAPLDSFILNLFWLNIGLGVGVTFILAPVMFPGAPIVLGIVLCTIFSAIHVAVYGLMSSAMPRSGGDYVYISRILSPVVGFTVSWSLTFLNVFIIVLATALFVWDGLSVGFGTIGALTESATLLRWSELVFEPNIQFTIGAVTILFFGSIMAFAGNRVFFVLQKIFFVLGMIAVLICLVLLLGSSHADFVSGFDTYFGMGTYQETIDIGKEFGASTAPTSLYALIGVIAVALWSMPWGYASAYIGGEVKRADRTQPLTMVGAVLFGGFFIALLGWLLIEVVGNEFLIAAGTVYSVDPFALPFALPPFFNLLVSVLTQNHILIILIALGFISWTFLWIPINILSGSRSIFAWAFDRIVPEKLAEVNERVHTPLYAILFICILAITFFGIYTYTGIYFLTSFMAPSLLGLVITHFTAMVFPYIKSSMYKNSALANQRIFGLPLISVLAAISMLFMATMFVFYLTQPVMGANSPAALISGAALYLSGIAIYYGVQKYRQHKDGVELSRLFEEIPPE